MEFLRPLLAKIELICQQLAMPQLSGVEGVASQAWGAGYDGWGLMGWSGYGLTLISAWRKYHMLWKVWVIFLKKNPNNTERDFVAHRAIP